MKRTLIAGLAVSALLVTACSADETDFRAAAERTIEEEIERVIEGDAVAECADPGSTDVGTTFECTGTASDGTTFDFTSEITDEDEVTVTATGPGGSATEGTLPAEETEPSDDAVPSTESGADTVEGN